MARQENRTGTVVGINGNMVAVEVSERIMQNEVAYVICGEDHLKAEVIRIRGQVAEAQVFEDTRGVKIGDQVEFSGELLSVELGPGLLARVFDGLQNPLPALAERHGFFLKRGAYIEPLDDTSRWEFTPKAKKGDTLQAGQRLGTVPEKMFDHWIMVPFHLGGPLEIVDIAGKGEYALSDTVAKLRDEHGREHEVSMQQHWPVKLPIKAYAKKIQPKDPMVTKIRIIDTLFPVAKGGTFCTPGPFGAGKTVLQHLISRHSEVDVVVVAACGERAGEVVELLREFPELEDPRTGRSLMDRTIIICNTSSMPVAARESSVYTAVTIAEYYRMMGLHVLLLADSTSRWAQAMREMSGRLEEIPGEEAYPAYLETRIASFYERAGRVLLREGVEGSVTIGGAVSPAGGNFEEPVTQSTLKVVGAFHGLSRERSDARRYPAIDPLDSWSKYSSFIDEKKVRDGFAMLRKSKEVYNMMKVIGEEGITIDDFIDYQKGEFFDGVYLQQNAFDKTDEATAAERQKHVYELIHSVLLKRFAFDSNDEVRRFFQKLHSKCINWNSASWGSDEFKGLEQEIKEAIASKEAQTSEA